MTANIQKLFTSYQPLGNTGSEETGATYVGQQGRLWYDPVTNTLRASDGNTAGGTIVGNSSSGGNPFGGNTQIQYSNNGIFGANANFTFDDVAQTLYFPDASVTGNIIPTLGNTFNLGSPDLKWANIYVGPNSIFIQDTANALLNAEITVTDGILYVNGVGAIAANTIVNGNSAIYIQPNANILFSANGGPNVLVVTSAGSNFSGYANVAGNLEVAGTANIVGAVDVTGNLTVDGNVDFTGANVSIGSVSNLSIGGGSNLQFLQTAGNGNLRWANAVYNVTTGVGLTGGGNGNVGIDATGVTTVAGTANQVFVNGNTSGGNSNAAVTLTLPQNIGTGSSPTFANITITDTLTVSNIVSTGNSVVDSKVLNLASNSTANTQIDQGGIILGNANAAYAVSILYDLANNEWNSDGAGLRTLNLVAANANIDYLNVQNSGHFGIVNEQLDYPNAYVQIDANVNSYSQIISQNHSPGTQASSDLVLVNDIGDDGNNYIDLGINSSNYANANYSATTGNDGYLFMNQGNLVIGTETAAKTIKFVAGGTTSSNIAASISNTGLTVTGNINANNITAANVLTFGTMLYGDTAYITELRVTGPVLLEDTVDIHNTLVVNANISGSNIIGNHYGAGNNLSNIRGSNVNGAVGLATFATTANAVAGANVSGAVPYATTANSVAGGNVVGAVANAAYSVTANYAAYAGNVTIAAQPNITSVGNLTNLVVTGNANIGTANLGNLILRSTGIHLGNNSGNVTNGNSSIAIGDQASNLSQGNYTVSIGYRAGLAVQGDRAIAIGASASYTNQGADAIAIGSQSGLEDQGANAIAIGNDAGEQGQGINSIAIGAAAGTGTPGSQAANSIILNATGTNFNATTTGFFVKPVTAAIAGNTVFYNPTSGQLTYGIPAAVPLPTTIYSGANTSVSLDMGINGTTLVYLPSAQVNITLSNYHAGVINKVIIRMGTKRAVSLGIANTQQSTSGTTTLPTSGGGGHNINDNSGVELTYTAFTNDSSNCYVSCTYF